MIGQQSFVTVCTDRAAVNIGTYNSGPKLRQLVAVGNSLVHILCTAHTLENCTKSADHNVPYCETSFHGQAAAVLFTKAWSKKHCSTEDTV